jgi:predicted Rossmann-fold nucleotide-binding protein
MRIVVYASSSTTTPEPYLRAARELGELLAKGGHTCVNGGGNVGGMGALNSSCSLHNGKIVTVIHRRWIVDGEEFALSNGGESIVVDVRSK